MKIYKQLCKLFQRPKINSKEIAAGIDKKAISEHQPSWMYKNE